MVNFLTSSTTVSILRRILFQVAFGNVVKISLKLFWLMCSPSTSPFHTHTHIHLLSEFLIVIMSLNCNLYFFSSHGDFVTIIDLPEGEHQYKFYVDGEWKHDPGVVCVWNKIGNILKCLIQYRVSLFY